MLTYFLLSNFLKHRRLEELRKKTQQKQPCLPAYYMWYSFLWIGIPFIVLLLAENIKVVSFFSSNDLKKILYPGVLLIFSGVGWVLTYKTIVERKCVRKPVEKALQRFMLFLTIVILIIIVLVLGVLLFESMRFFSQVSFFSFIFGTNWMPNDLLESANNFGAAPLFLGTLFITFLALIITVPLGTMVAICLCEYANKHVMQILRPALETMAGIPTVVYGFFAAIVVAPFFQEIALFFGIAASAQSAITAGVVLGVMLIPMLTSLYMDVLNAVPNSLREASLGLGATKSETIIKVVLPIAKPGMVGALLLTFSRAIGETMLVVMAAGLAANLTLNPFSSVTTVTVQIVSLLTGDQEFDSLQTLSAFALGFILFFITLLINFVAERFSKKVIV